MPKNFVPSITKTDTRCRIPTIRRVTLIVDRKAPLVPDGYMALTEDLFRLPKLDINVSASRTVPDGWGLID